MPNTTKLQTSDIALVTGASSGLGVEYCRQLATHCKKIILVARSEAPMIALAKEIEAMGAEAEVVVADLNTGLGIARVIETVRQKGPITILVNNAGFTTVGNFADKQVEGQQEMVSLHINATLSLCRAVIPFMREVGHGKIINLSSTASFVALEGASVYSATKAFLNMFSEGLQKELKHDNIKVQAFCPGYTRTGFHATTEFDGFDTSIIPEEKWANASDTVAASINALDTEATIVVHGEQNFELAQKALGQQLSKIAVAN